MIYCVRFLMENDFEVGDQIIYKSAGGDKQEQGFVWEITKMFVFCRFFFPDESELRTKCSAEGCRREDLTRMNFMDQNEIDAIIAIWRDIWQE